MIFSCVCTESLSVPFVPRWARTDSPILITPAVCIGSGAASAVIVYWMTYSSVLCLNLLCVDLDRAVKVWLNC